MNIIIYILCIFIYLYKQCNYQSNFNTEFLISHYELIKYAIPTIIILY